jgi:hypothetical protein
LIISGLVPKMMDIFCRMLVKVMVSELLW